jgi:hypothetical protein
MSNRRRRGLNGLFTLDLNLGYQPDGTLDLTNPPKGGSGVPEIKMRDIRKKI